MSQYIYRQLNITPDNAVIDLRPKAGWDYQGPRNVSLRYWTETADPASSEGFSVLFEWLDEHGAMQSMGGVPIGVMLDAASGSQQNFPAQQIDTTTFVMNPGTALHQVTTSKSNVDPYGVGTSKVSWMLIQDIPEHTEAYDVT